MIGRRSVLLFVCLAMMLSVPVAGRQEATPSFEPLALQPQRAYFSQFPFESIDMVNGNLILTFTDLVLPGNAGMDLVIQRTFNRNRHPGIGLWSFGIAGIPMQVVNPDAPWPDGDPERATPLLLMADGGEHRTMPANGVSATDVWLTNAFWKYTVATRQLELPNGWVGQYTQDSPALLDYLVDPFGNRITVVWDTTNPTFPQTRRVAEFRQEVGTHTRVVSLTYGSDWLTFPSTMTYGTRSWTYDVHTPVDAAWYVASVTQPDGSAWTFNHSDGLQVTTPHGGTVDYSFQDRVFPDSAFIRKVVSERTVGGRDVPTAAWSFQYTPPDAQQNYSAGIASGPNDISIEWRHEGALDGRWVLTRKALKDGAVEVAVAQRSYTHLGYLPWASGPGTVPAIEEEAILQDGVSHTTTYGYRANDAANYFGDRHRPSTITETGQLTRTTTRSYDYDFTFHVNGPVSQETVTVGNESFTSTFAYENSTGFLESLTALGVTTSFGRDVHGNRNRVTPPGTHPDGSLQTSFTHEYGALKDTIAPEYTISRDINSDGTVASEQRGDVTTSFFYDDLFRQWKITRDAVDDTVTDYHADSVSVTQGASSTTTYLDGFGRPTGTATSAGSRTGITYDAHGRKVFETYLIPINPQPHEIKGDSLEYDVLGRIKKITHADNTFVRYDYPAAGQVHITDENGHVTIQYWEAFGNPADARLDAVRDARNKLWQYNYNGLGSLEEVTAPDGTKRTWVYDAQNRLESETHPESGKTEYRYNAVGNLDWKKDAEQRITTFEYDRNNRLTKILTPDNADDVEFRYDALDSRWYVKNAHVTTTNSFVDGQLRSRTDAMGSNEFITRFEYDARENLTKITYPSGHYVHYDYDAGNRIHTVWGNAGQGVQTFASSIAYFPSGSLKSYTYGSNQQTVSMTEDARQRPDQWTSGPLSLNYDHDGVGNVTKITDARGSDFLSDFTYDSLDRLERVSGWGARSYSYDDHGNRLTQNGTQSIYEYSATTLRLDRIIADTQLGGGFMTYDNVGNLKTDTSGTQYTYSSMNMMRTAAKGGITTTYGYDGDNQRAHRDTPAGREYFVRSASGQLLSEYVPRFGGVRWQRDYVYLGSRLLASLTAAPTVPSVAFAASPLAIAENGDSIDVQVVLTVPFGGQLDSDVTVRVHTSSQNAVSPGDFTAYDQTITFAAGTAHGSPAATRTITIPIAQDNILEAVEEFHVLLSSVSGGTTGSLSTAVVQISDDEIACPRDFDCDGKPDLLWQNDANGELIVWFMKGIVADQLVEKDRTYLDPFQWSDTSWKIVGSGDFTGDGKPDLVWQHATTRELALWAMSGRQRIGATLAFSPTHIPLGWAVKAVGDANNDGKPDLYLQNVGSGELCVWLMNGLTLIDGVMISPAMTPGTPWEIVGAGDMDGDGYTDLYWQHTDGSVAWWRMQGTTRLDVQLALPNTMPAGWRIRGVADVNGDGDLDWWIHHAADDDVGAWLMRWDAPTQSLNLIDGLLVKPIVGDLGQGQGASWKVVGPR